MAKCAQGAAAGERRLRPGPLEVRAIAEEGDHRRTDQRQHRRAQDHRLPGKRRTRGADAVRQRRAERQHPHQQAKAAPGSGRPPADDQFHAERVDAGQRQPDQEAEHEAAAKVGTHQRKQCIEQGAGNATGRDDPAGPKAVGEAGEGDRQRAENEAALYRIGQPADVGGAQVPQAREVGSRAVGAEPERGGQ